MITSINDNNISYINSLCGYVGAQAIAGNTDAIMQLYGYSYTESPPIIKTISLLQENITSVEIENDSYGIYDDVFLYYLAMLNIGETSNLIFRDLDTAETCLTKIVQKIPQVRARLAYIKLLETDEPSRSESNVKRIDILRKWAGKQDLFSRIAIAKIAFYQFLTETQAEEFELPVKVFRLLEVPCQRNHPVAIRFYNEILTQQGSEKALSMKLSESNIDHTILYDL